MTTEQLVTVIINLPGLAVLIWVITKQDIRIDKLLEGNQKLIDKFMTFHPPADTEADKIGEPRRAATKVVPTSEKP